MRFTRLELLNWDIQANQVIVLQPGVNLLTGENGSGKTTILDAIKVVLGGTRIGGDRSVEDYLAVRTAPFAMIRLVADNAPDVETGRRPFDSVKPSEVDLFTLAVVYKAGEEGYTPEWYLCPGDVSPLQRGFDGRSFTRKSDYTTRLDKLGMGRSFRKLLCTPQGQVASLCQHDPSGLFDLLFDFIGGKQVLDEWEMLRRDFERQQRTRDERGQVLQRREEELDGLRQLLRAHQRYRDNLDRLHRARGALPVARLAEARSNLERAEAQQARLEALEAGATAEVREADEALTRVGKQEDAARVTGRELSDRRADLDDRWEALQEERAEARADLKPLDALRQEVAGLEPEDLETLEAERTTCEDRQAALRNERAKLKERVQELNAELKRLNDGLLTPPAAVDDFRAVLRRHEIPHHLLLDLIEPNAPDGAMRRALESYLGDFRFAVAVPDVPTFVRAIALARDHRFPFYVLAPDVRSRTPKTGDHPFLEQVEVRDPKYRGLVTRVLRHLRWLEVEVVDTHRERGVLVDSDGFVLDRKGGRYQGTDRFYLGREALERRRTEVEAERRRRRDQDEAIQRELKARSAEREQLKAAIAREERRREWVESEAAHRRLTELVARVAGELETLEQERRSHASRLDAHQNRLRELVRERVREETRRRQAREEIARHRKAGDELQVERDRLRSAVSALAATLDTEPDPEVIAYAQQHTVAVLENIESNAEHALQGFEESERDANLPANVETLEKQVEAVRGELDRLDADVDRAREAAERAHSQYKLATRRIFRRYFASLTDSGGPLGFTLEGGLRARDDGRFAVDIQIAAGDKDLVSYSSPSLSGGQKAALSMLMAMTTLRVHDTGDGPGFFLVDEPFSASDTHKIQELGAFLERTGAQYLVSMPTTEELRRCGAWLQAVLTCTLTPGGRDAAGRLCIAPPVKCSYVVHDGA